MLCGGDYSDSPSRALSLLSLFLSSLGWDSYSWYFISLNVTCLQGENGARICQISWPWDCNWEIPPSVHILPQRCAQTDADGGSRSAGPWGFTFLVHDVTTSSGHPFWYSFQVTPSSGLSSAGCWLSLVWALGDSVSKCFWEERLAIVFRWKKPILRVVAY